MTNMDHCDFCGKKTKIKYICPICGKTFCPEHRSAKIHGCETPNDAHLHTDKQVNQKPVEDTPVEQTITQSDSLINSNAETNETKSYVDVPVPVYLFNEDNIELPKNVNDEKSKKSTKNVDKENGEVSKKVKKEKSKKPTKNVNKDKGIETPKIADFIIPIKKQILVLLIIVATLSAGYLYMNGGLFPNAASDSVKGSQEYDAIMQNYTSLLNKYNDLSMQYAQLESTNSKLQEKYSELQIAYNSSVDFAGESLLENMKQITIAPGSNAIFFYEIPKPGYITVEYYSNEDIYAIVGTTALDNVYYSRNPQSSKSSELTFSVPVLPDINIMFTNPSDKEATLFFRVDYYCN